MTIKNVLNVLEEIAPPFLQESYDNTGLLIGSSNAGVTGVLITLDITGKVLEEAIKKNCNLIVSHHPVIFKGLKSITGKNFTERIVAGAIKNDIALYAIHTNLDNVDIGVNSILCDKLGLINRKILAPKNELLRKLVTFCPVDDAEKVRQAIFRAGAGNIGNYDSCSFNTPGKGTFRGSNEANPYVGEKDKLHYENETRIETIYPVYLEKQVLNALFTAHPYEEVAYDIYLLGNEFSKVGAGMLGELEEEMETLQFLKKVKEITNIPCIKHSELISNKVKKVAVCGGSGSFLIKDAIGSGADVFVTGDVKYHDFFEAEDKIIIADIGHYESEQFAKELIYNVLNKKFSTFAVLISENNTNSVNYL
ncbi:MAG: Nif3-like dinuclear metal center hexameric protein [Bacteroidales bacterium]